MKLPPSVKNITARKMVNALIRAGFSQTHQRGSHRYFHHTNCRMVDVYFHHWGDSFPPKHLKTMIKDAGWDVSDLKRLKLIPKRDP